MERGKEQPVRTKTTVIVRPDLWKRVRLLAVQEDKQVFEVVEAALSEYLSKAERKK